MTRGLRQLARPSVGREGPGSTAAGLAGWWRRRREAASAGRDRAARAGQLYRAVVGRARAPELYRELGVPDTPEGRFEMVAVHTALLVRRLRREGGESARTAEAVVETMITDMDRSVRELGVGDLSVGRYVKRMAGSLLARWQTLDGAVPSGDLAAIEAMLARNLFPQQPVPSHVDLARLAGRLLHEGAALDRAEVARLLAGELP